MGVSDDRPRTPLDEIDDRIKAARERGGGPESRDRLGERERSSLGLAFRIGAELVSALLVGIVLGWLVDRWLGTFPWVMVLGFVLGSVAGILNVYRAVAGLGYAVGYGTRNRRDDDRTD
jgi:ATP synthase protein I